MIARLGPNILDITLEDFIALLGNQKGKTRVKALLLDQSRLAGIGNAYIHDILFLAQRIPTAGRFTFRYRKDQAISCHSGRIIAEFGKRRSFF
jgi:formamidopyrimidine-DNA glycosylase